MVNEALVRAVAQAARRLETHSWGASSVVALLPAQDEESNNPESFACIIAAPWIVSENATLVLSRFAKELRNTVPYNLIDAVARVVALPTDDAFVVVAQSRFSSVWAGEPIEIRDMSLGGRPSWGGVIVSVSRPSGPVPKPEAETKLSAPFQLDLPASELFESDPGVANAPLSNPRVAKFSSSLNDDRAKGSIVEALLRLGDRVRESEGLQPEIVVKVLLRKGPFVDASSWAEYRTWDFALAFERKLGETLAQLLETTPSRGTSPPDDWPGLWKAILEARSEFRTNGPFAVLVTGDIGERAIIEAMRLTPPTWWNTTQARIPLAIGEVDGIPICRLLRENDQPSAAAYLVDLSRLALVRRARYANKRLVNTTVGLIDPERTQRFIDDERMWPRPWLHKFNLQLKRDYLAERVEVTATESWNVSEFDGTAVARIEVISQTSAPPRSPLVSAAS